MAENEFKDLIYLIALLFSDHFKVPAVELRTRIAEAGSIEKVWTDSQELSLFSQEISASILLGITSQLENWAQQDIKTLSYLDPQYPNRLRSINEMPLVLWAKGKILPDYHAVSVVGTRQPDKWALNFVDDLVRGLSSEKITIVSGLAKGIDTQAHTSAIKHGSRTVAVLGNGIEHKYPRENSQLQEAISELGLVVSQFMPRFNPTKYSFPMRNATMSGYSGVSIIVQASEFSGTRIQGRIAVGHGRPVILTKQVAYETKWGFELKNKPGVFVVKNADEAIELAKIYATTIPSWLLELLPDVSLSS